jgi:hypothetical protein
MDGGGIAVSEEESPPADDAPADAPADERSDGTERAAELTQRFWAIGFPVLTVLLALAVPALLVTGRTVMLHSTDGAFEDLVTDPAAPGWRAYTEPTPTALVLQRDGSGALVGVTLVSLTAAGAGALVFVPVDTLAVPAAGVPAGASSAGIRTLAELAADGEPAVRAGVEELLGVAPTDVVSLDPTAWRDIVEPVAPLTVENPDDVFVAGAGGSPTQRFAKGQLTLSAADVPDYLAARSVGELDLNRMVRHEAFWAGWLQAVGKSTAPDAVPGEPGTGLARYVRALSSAHIAPSTLPVQVLHEAGGPDRYVPVAGQVRELLTRAVPTPVSSPGRRLRIRLLDGVGTLQHGQDAAARLVAGGGQIDQIGNAASFGVPRTKLEFADENHRREVEALAAALGMGEVVRTTNIDGVADVVVTLGQDYVGARAPQTGGTGG